MAMAEIKYGSNAQLIELARMIVAEQTSDIQQFDAILVDMAATA